MRCLSVSGEILRGPSRCIFSRPCLVRPCCAQPQPRENQIIHDRERGRPLPSKNNTFIDATTQPSTHIHATSTCRRIYVDIRGTLVRHTAAAQGAMLNIEKKVVRRSPTGGSIRLRHRPARTRRSTSSRGAAHAAQRRLDAAPVQQRAAGKQHVST